jgi:hypothetical protein
MTPFWVAGIPHHEYLWWNMGSVGKQSWQGQSTLTAGDHLGVKMKF